MKARPGLALALVGVVALAHAVLLFDAPFEDSFITFRYAEHLANGQGLTYNPGEVVEGFTSFGWTVLLAALARVGIGIVAASRVLSVVFGLLLLWLTARTSRRWTGRDDAWSVVPALVVAANGTWAYYAMTGMETTLFALLVSAGIYFASGDSRRAGALAGLAFAASALVRPEGLGYLGVVSAALVFERRRPMLAPMLAVFAAIFVPYFAWRWHHFGYPLPNTYYAKASPSGAVFRNGAAQTEAYFTAHLFWLVPVALVVLVRARGWTRGWRLASFVVLGAIVNMILVGGDGFAFYRFLLPAMPAGAIAMVAALVTLAERRPAGGLARRALLFAPFVLVAWTFAAELRPLGGGSERERVENVRKINEDYFVVGDWLRATFPGKTMAINAAGIVPYVSGLETIDMLGLNDVHIAHVPIRLGEGTLGHEKHDGDYVLSRRPDLILLGLPVLMKRPLAPGELDAAVSRWFRFLPGDREIYESEAFRRDYAPIGAEAAPGKFMLLFVRRAT